MGSRPKPLLPGLSPSIIYLVTRFHQARLPNMPYGGYKQSGIGREFGRHGLDEYLEVKAIQIKLG